MSDRITDWLMQFSLDQVGPLGVTTAKHAILDTLACSVAGAPEQGAVIVRSWVESMDGRGEATLVGSSHRAPAAFAAQANAAAAHALDLDDVAMTMIHPSAVLVPTLFALGEREGSTGREVIEAYIAGFEVMTRICRALNPEHYARGWHSMQTVGVLGTAAAAARLLHLDVEQSKNAIAIAASSSGGIRANFGSMVKPLHGSHAAFHGIEAADLARRGFTGGDDVLEGKNGFLELFSSPDRAQRLCEVFDPLLPLEIESSGIAIKRFACCGAIHSALDSIQELRDSAGFDVDAVTRIECRVNRLTPGILVHSDAQTGLEGKFSMEYSAAVMALTGQAGLAQYSEQQAGDLRLRALMQRVELVVDESLPVDLATFATIVTVELEGGESMSRRKAAPHGYPSDPLSAEERHTKVRDCCTPQIGPESTEALIALVEALDEQPSLDTITGCLKPAHGGGHDSYVPT